MKRKKLHFGSKRQRTAARQALSKKRHSKAKRANPPRRRKQNRPRTRVAAHRPRTAKRRNIGEVVYLLGANPAKRRKSMARTKTVRRRAGKKSNAGRRHYTKRRNPGLRHHRRRNPAGSTMVGYLKAGASVIGGAVGSKALTQLVLSTSNTSWMGYAGNAVATGLLAWASHLAFRDKLISQMVVAGGVAQIIVRVMTDQTPYGSYLSGAGVGDYMTNWNFIAPQRVGGGYPPNRILNPGGPWAQSSVPVVTHAGPAGKGVGTLAGDWN